MTSDSDTGRPLEPVPAKTEPPAEKSAYITPALALGAIPLLILNWFITAATLGRDCVVYEGGNITECAWGLSEEEVSAASGLIALVMLVIQILLIVLVRRRIRSGLR
ncbi:hypothetical protein ACIBKY_55350 [Nonomuraea sp. NPDC050394]|uniref:hypothetical protein n=1 Tax=Nonomuraea sp. NPDC050394 TaxID=3364363 RepID=UPI0037BA41EB